MKKNLLLIISYFLINSTYSQTYYIPNVLVSTFFNQTPGFGGQFGDIVKDPSGNLYMVDALYNIILKISPSGKLDTIAGSGYQMSSNGIGKGASFNRPAYITIDPFNNLYVTENGNTIRKITPLGVVTTFAGSYRAGNKQGQDTTARFNQPCGLASDKNGNIYVADNYNHAIRKITPQGLVSTATTKAYYPDLVAIDKYNNLYIYTKYYKERYLYKVSPSDVYTKITNSDSKPKKDGFISTEMHLSITDMTIDDNMNIYLTSDDQVKMITSTGKIYSLAGKANSYGDKDGYGSKSYLSGPIGIVCGNNGELYVTESYNKKIRKIIIPSQLPQDDDYPFDTKILNPGTIIKDITTNYIKGRNITSSCNTSVIDSNTIDTYYTFLASNNQVSITVSLDNPSWVSSMELIDTSTYASLSGKCLTNIGIGQITRTYIFTNLTQGVKYKVRFELGNVPSTLGSSRLESTNNTFSIQLESSTTSIEDNIQIKKEKKLVRIYNLLGEEVNRDYNGIIIYQYDDGTTTKFINSL